MAIRRFREPIGASFHRWIEASVAHARETLEFREIRTGVQALVRGRGPGSRGPRAMDGAGKRAAFTCYFAPLEFAAAHLAGCSLFAGKEPGRPRRIIDIACGVGATGAGLATAFETPPLVFGVEKTRAALPELRRTWSAFGVEGRVVPSVPRAVGRGDLVCVGWRPGSPLGAGEERLLGRVAAAARRGASVLVLEPAGFADDARHARWSERLEPLGVSAARMRPSIERPAFIRRMDKAARLDHQRLVMRLLVARSAGR